MVSAPLKSLNSLWKMVLSFCLVYASDDCLDNRQGFSMNVFSFQNEQSS
jgi:hypothetical protein